MLEFLITILLYITGILLGFYLLLFGRRALWATTGIITLASAGNLLAFIFLGENNIWVLAEGPDWLLLGITIGVGIIGGLLGARAVPIAASIVGFLAGGSIALWLYDIAFYIIVEIGQWPEQTATTVGVVILIIGGLIGLYLTRRSQAVALIMISVFVGTDLVVRGLNLSQESSFTAVIAISLALLGLVVQYAHYLREIKAESPFVAAETGKAPAPEMFDLSDDR